MNMLRYTGHPFIDVGVATIVAAANVDVPNQVTDAQIESFTEEVVRLYMNPAMAGYLSYVVFANARFANPAQIKNPKYDEARRASLRELLNLWRANASIPTKDEPADEGERCVFSGDLAVIRASRMFIPLTTDETNINFVPEGRPRLPVAGWCLLALLVMPLGCLNSEGKMWLVHSTDPETTLHFVRQNLARNRQAFHRQGLEKLPNYKFAKTHLMKGLLESQTVQVRAKHISLSAYLFTSSGQKSEVNIYYLPSNILRFVTRAHRFYGPTWQYIVKRAGSLQNSEPEIEDGKLIYTERNYFYEDLFDLPYNSKKFLHRYLLRRPLKGKPIGKQKVDPRYDYSFLREREAISWGLTELFLEEVMKMDKERITHIMNMADRLAGYIKNKDSRLFRHLFTARSDYHMRLALLKAANNADGVLLPSAEFLQAFFVDEGETLRPDWYLARDLLMLRIIEKLHEDHWIEAHKDFVEETNAKVEDPQD